jgi:acarbose 7IV-phosphotransferase
MTATADVVVVGNVGVDTNVYLHGDVDLAHETDYTENLDTLGQSGGYSARGFARLGHRTTFLGYVGDDAFGRFVRSELESDGVDTTQLAIDPAGTNRSVNLMSPAGQRHSFYDGKSHMTLEPDLARWAAVLRDARLVHFSIPNWARYLLAPAKAAGCTVSCDLQDVRDVDDPYRRDFRAAADVLFFSATHVDASDALRALRSPGQIAVCGLGAEGCAVATDDGVRFFPPVELADPVVDTNGAGDSLAVGFLSSLILDGSTIEQAARRGQLAARWCCTRRGTSRGLATRALLDRLAAG